MKTTNNTPPTLSIGWRSQWLIGGWWIVLTTAYGLVTANAVRYYLGKMPVIYGALVGLAGTFVLAALLLTHWRWRGWRTSLIWLGTTAALALVLTLTARQGLALLVALWIFVLAYVWGAALTRHCTVNHAATKTEDFCLNAALGLTLLAAVMLALGFTHLLTPRWIWAAMVLLTLCLTRGLLRLVQKLRNVPPFLQALRQTPFAFPEQGVLAVTLALLLAFSLALALLPETRFDALNYQLAVPRMYLEQGRFVDLPNFWHSYHARLTNLLFALALGLEGPIVARLIVLASGVVTVAGVFALTQRLSTARAAWWAVALFAATPLMAWLAVTTYVDLPLTMFFTASLLAFLRWQEQRSAGWLWCSGALAGAALGTKLTAAYGLVLLDVLILFWLVKGPKPALANRVGQVAGYAVCLLLIAAPLHAFTYAHTGNPVFPLYNAVFKSPGWPLENSRFNADLFGIGTSWLALLRLPFAFVFQSRLFGETNPNGTFGVFLLLCPLAFWLYRKQPRLTALLLAQCVIFWWLWAHSFQYGRYYAPLHPLIVALAVASVFSLPLTTRLAQLRGWVLSGWLIAQGVLLPFTNGDLLMKQPFRYWLGRESTEAFLTRALSGYAAIPFLNQHTQGADRIASADTEQLRFYVHAPLDTMTETRAWEELLRLTDDAALAAEMYRRHYRFIWVVGLDAYDRQPWLTFLRPSFLERHATLEFSHPDTRVYRLHPPSPFAP